MLQQLDIDNTTDVEDLIKEMDLTITEKLKFKVILTKIPHAKKVEPDDWADFGNDEAKQNHIEGDVIELIQDNSMLVKLLLFPNGVLFENEIIQIGFRSQIEIPGGVMRILLYYGNKSNSKIYVKSTKCMNQLALNDLGCEFIPLSFDIAPKQQLLQRCRVILNAPITSLPSIEILFSHLKSYRLYVAFPIIATKFCQQHVFEAKEFDGKWQQLKCEEKKVIEINNDYDGKKLRDVLSNGMNIAMIDGVDQNPNNSVGCCVYHFAKKKEDNNYVTMPVLLRVEFNPENHKISVTVRTPYKLPTDSIMAAISAVFEK